MGVAGRSRRQLGQKTRRLGEARPKGGRLKLYWLPTALKNFDNQIGYIAKDSPKAAIEQGGRVL